MFHGYSTGPSDIIMTDHCSWKEVIGLNLTEMTFKKSDFDLPFGGPVVPLV